MQGRRTVLIVLLAVIALTIGGVDQAEALSGCVRAPLPALTNKHGAGLTSVRLEPSVHTRALKRLRPGTPVLIDMTPHLRHICPTHGFYPVLYEDPVSYEEIWGWVPGDELRV
jgi:hypothetical protein